MCLKNVISFKRKGGGRSWSISASLTAHYALSAFVILTLSTCVLYWGLVISLDYQSGQYQKDEINVFNRLLRDPRTAKSVAEKIEVGYAAREFMKTYARLLDENGRTLLETHQMSAVIPPAVFPAPSAKDGPYGRITKWKSPTGKYFLMRAIWVYTEDPKHERRLLQIALDTTSLRKVLTDYQQGLAVVLLLGIITSAGAGMYISRRGMRPLREIAERTRRVTVTNLGERLQPLNWPEEVDDLANALDAMLDRLQLSFRRLNQYSANLAHELRTPIGNLRGEAEVALSRARTAAEYKRIIESSLEEYERLSNMIDSLLFLARSANKEAPLDLSEIDVRSEIENICDYFKAMAIENGIELTCGGEAVLTADLVLFRRTVSNLLSNALKYTPSGGKVDVAVRQTEDSLVEIAVRDTGCGIPPEHLGKVFDRFYRIGDARYMNPLGSGLGLSIVKSIMDLHGGTVSIQSEPSAGTTVTLVFPDSPKDFSGSILT
jgi:two-component system heavy metal sensor histidine kinase CusS